MHEAVRLDASGAQPCIETLPADSQLGCGLGDRDKILNALLHAFPISIPAGQIKPELGTEWGFVESAVPPCCVPP
jgi:hypothetical protein